tara:strand:- start:666 stop:812 length:147 start_codon:yes stop_codon:yes gene_type:complete
LKKYDELKAWIDQRGVTPAQTLKLAGVFALSLGVVGILLYGAIGATLL